MFTYILYGLAAAGLLASFLKDKKKTKMALKKAWKAFENILPQFLTVILIVGFALTVLGPQTISKLVGSESGIIGVLAAALVGAITMIPGVVAFPLAAALLESGAGYMQLTALISSLMMVGIVTMPMEIKTFGKKMTFLRNGAAFLCSIAMALLMGVLMK